MRVLSVSSRLILRWCQTASVVVVWLSCAAVPAKDTGRLIGNAPIPRASVSEAAREAPEGRAPLVQLDFDNVSVVSSPKGAGKFDILRMKGGSSLLAEAAIQYEAGDDNDRRARIVPDPVRKNNQVLQYWLKHARVPGERKGHFKGRIQLNLANINKTEIYERHRMYLHPDLGLYRSYPKENHWFTISTLWIGQNNRPNPFKISLNIVKENGVGKPLYFMATGDMRIGGKPRHGKWKNVWGKVNTDFQVPLGEWFDVEMGYKQGDGKSGRYYLGVKRESDVSMIPIFDIADWTYNPKSPEPIPLTNWNPFKLYTSDEVIDFIREKGGVAQIYWDDLEISERWPN